MHLLSRVHCFAKVYYSRSQFLTLIFLPANGSRASWNIAIETKYLKHFCLLWLIQLIASTVAVHVKWLKWFAELKEIHWQSVWFHLLCVYTCYITWKCCRFKGIDYRMVTKTLLLFCFQLMSVTQLIAFINVISLMIDMIEANQLYQWEVGKCMLMLAVF